MTRCFTYRTLTKANSVYVLFKRDIVYLKITVTKTKLRWVLLSLLSRTGTVGYISQIQLETRKKFSFKYDTMTYYI